MDNKNFIIITILLVISAVIGIKAVLPGKFGSAQEAKMTDFPTVIGEWRGVDMPLLERDYEILGTKNLIMRDYKNAQGDSVYLYIIYSQDNRKTLHPPEICYTGGGASTITKKSVIPLTDSLKANKFVIEYKDSRQLVIYWFRSGSSNTYSYLQQQFKFVLNRTVGKRTSGSMVRASMLIKDNNQEAALKLIKEFCGKIEPLLERYVP